MGMLVRLALCATLAAALLLGGWFVRHEVLIWWSTLWVLFIKFLGLVLWAGLFLLKMLVGVIGKFVGAATFGEMVTILGSRFLRSVPGKVLWAVIALLVPMPVRAYYRRCQIFGREIGARALTLIKLIKARIPGGKVGIALSIAATLAIFLIATAMSSAYQVLVFFGKLAPESVVAWAWYYIGPIAEGAGYILATIGTLVWYYSGSIVVWLWSWVAWIVSWLLAYGFSWLFKFGMWRGFTKMMGRFWEAKFWNRLFGENFRYEFRMWRRSTLRRAIRHRNHQLERASTTRYGRAVGTTVRGYSALKRRLRRERRNLGQ